MSAWVGAALVVMVLGMMMGAGTTAPAARDAAVWVYGAHRWASAGVEARLRHLPGGARHLYLSVEDGARLILDDPGDAKRLADLLDLAEGRLGLAVDAMLLQDASWAADPDRAAARVARVLAFQRGQEMAGRHGFSGLHFDTEPFSGDAWACGDAGARRAIVRRLHAVFAEIGRVVGESGMRLRLSAALPWWLASLGAGVDDAAPRAWLDSLDEAVLMVYGEPGGPLTGDSAAAALARVGGNRIWSGLPAGRGLRVGLATYEYRDEATLAASMREIEAGLARWPGYEGVALFAYGQPFAAPLVTTVVGRVVDAAAHPIAGAVVRAAGQLARTAPCGLFTLRGLPRHAIEVTVEAQGFASESVSIAGLIPGRQRELPPIMLRPRAAAGSRVLP